MANEENETNNKGGGFFTGFLLGMIIGAALSFLFAPRRGERTEEQVRGKLDELISQARRAWEEGKQAASEIGAELQARLEQLREKRG